jgi:hypothetical protein
MARRVTRLPTGPLFVLDAQGLSLLADEDRRMMARLEVATTAQYLPVISAITVVEQRRTGTAGRRLAWVRSRLTVIDVTEDIADRAAALLDQAGLDGHECAVDAVVVATAANGSGPAKVVPGDGSHIPALCKAAGNVTWVPV